MRNIDIRQLCDDLVIDMMTKTIETLHNEIPLSGGAGRIRAHPGQRYPVEKNVPGWKEQVEPFRQDYLFWAALHKSVWSPSRGVLPGLGINTTMQ